MFQPSELSRESPWSGRVGAMVAVNVAHVPLVARLDGLMVAKAVNDAHGLFGAKIDDPACLTQTYRRSHG